MRLRKHAARYTAFNVLKEFGSKPRVPSPYHPRNHRLGISFDSNEVHASPQISRSARSFVTFFWLGSNEAPDFVYLNSACRDVAECAVLIIGASRADFREQSKDRFLCNVS